MKKILLLFSIIFSNFIIAQSIISVTPNNGNRGQQDLEVTITTQDIDFSVTSPIVDASFIDQFGNILPADWTGEFYYANELRASFSIPGYAAPGLYDLSLAEVNGDFTLTLPNAFTVNNAYTYSIQGNVRYDSNSNGCDASDISVPAQKIRFTNGSAIGYIYAFTGFYNYYDVQAGNNSFTPILQNPTYFTVSPPSASVVLSTSNNVFTQDFCISPNGTHNDLEVSIYPYGSARPGFDATYLVSYKNNGTQSQNGTIKLSFDDSIMDLVTADPAIGSQGTNALNWSFSNLQPFEKREILVTMNLNSAIENPPVNVGNSLYFNAAVNGATDETPIDNFANLYQTVVASLDPNDKTCAEGHSLPISEVGKYLHYIIHFENSGTANAENIVVSDLIDTSKFDVSTLVPLSGSASFTTKISNTNLVEFIFENINLPFDDANNDGYVAFKIKSLPTLVEGDDINNSANIYFDYNAPIITNMNTVNVFNPLATTDFEFGSVYTLSPVPAKNNLTITAKKDVVMNSITIYNTLGQLVQVITNPTETIDISGLKTGSYFIKVISDEGTSSSKFIKE